MHTTPRFVAATSLSAALAAVMFGALPARVGAAGSSCEDLRGLAIDRGRIDAVQSVSPGAFAPPASRGGAGSSAFAQLSAFCRVSATLTPSSDSDIRIEVWLPSSGWNNKLQAVGNGGWAGTIGYPALGAALKKGYAAVATDTGHSGDGASFAFEHPERFIDYAYRSEHEMTVAAKTIVNRFYGAGPKLSYFNGCSTGGRQALVEASRYPDDFDGIIAGAAANPKAHLDAWRIWNAQAMHATSDSFIAPAKYPIIHAAVLAQCDALDGAKDGLLENPTTCQFDPGTLLCKGGDEPGCLTAAQVKTARVIMSPAKNRRTGELIFPTYEPGSELGWGRLLGGADPYATAVDQYKYVVFNNPRWDWRTFDLERDTALADAAADGVLAAVNPDLTSFAQHGGKLITYHGFSDPSIAPQASINFYRSAIKATRPPASSPESAEALHGAWHGPLQRRRRSGYLRHGGRARGMGRGRNTTIRVLASRIVDAKVVRTRPLCPFPQVAHYSGTGSLDDAANFACVRQPQ